MMNRPNWTPQPASQSVQQQWQLFKARYKLQPNPTTLWPSRAWQPSAVLLPIIEKAGELQVILTRRTSHLRHHAGQICFPGGRKESTDQSLLATALRETEEEIGVSSQKIQILGRLNSQPVLSSFLISPYVATLAPQAKFKLDPNEVADLFYVPLAYLMDQKKHWQLKKNHPYYPWIHFIPWQNQLIWGATAAIIRNLADQINPEGKDLYQPLSCKNYKIGNAISAKNASTAF